MTTYSLSGTGSQALSADVTALHVSITTLPNFYGNGRSNPVSHYDIGLLRFGDGTGFWEPIPIVGGPQWLGVPQGTTALSYVVFGSGVISVVEVVGGTIPFSGPAGATGPTGPAGSAGSSLIQTTTAVGTETAFDFTAIPNTFTHLQLWLVARLDTVTTDDFINLQLNGDTGANYTYCYLVGGNAGAVGVGAAAGNVCRVADVSASSAPANGASRYVIDLPFYLDTAFHKSVQSRGTLRYGSGANNTQVYEFAGEWLNVSAITEVKLLANSGHLVAGSKAALYGVV